MTDFFGNLAIQVLSTIPEVKPLSPSRFAPWPGIPHISFTSVLREPANTLEQAEATQLSTALVDPDNTEVDIPMPTFRQMSELSSTSEPLFQTGSPLVDQPKPETIDFEQTSFHQAGETPAHPVLEKVLQDAPPTNPAVNLVSPSVANKKLVPPVLHDQVESDIDGAVTSASARSDASTERSSKGKPLLEHYQVLPPPLAKMDRVLPSSHAESVKSRSVSGKVQPELIEMRADSVKGLVEPAEGRPEPVKASHPETVKGRLQTVEAGPREAKAEPVNVHVETIEAQIEPVGARPEPVKGQIEPVKARPEAANMHTETIEDNIKSVSSQPEPVVLPVKPIENRAEAVKKQPELVNSRAGSIKSHSESINQHTEPVEGHTQHVKNQPELVEARAGPIEDQPEPTARRAEPFEERRVNMPVQPLAHPPASASLTAQPDLPTPGPVLQRQSAPGGDQSTASLAPPPVLTAEPDPAITTQVRAAPKTTSPALLIGSPEPDLPVSLGQRGSSEPVILPAPEPAPWGMRSIPGNNDDKDFLPPPLDWLNTDEPEATPTVRVTIGRVVVRASPAGEPPPSRRVELAKPPLALEDYLKNRQGGER